MQRIAILTDTTSDVDPSIIKEYNIVEVPLQIIYNSEVTYKDKYEKNIDDVINDINSNTISSSLPLASDLIDKIEKIISEGYTHIIATCMSCGISGTYNLFQQILSLYSDKITYHLIDCRSCSMGMGFLIEKAVKMKENGISFEEIVKELEKVIQDYYPNVKIYKRPISSLFVIHTGPHIYGAVVTLK